MATDTLIAPPSSMEEALVPLNDMETEQFERYRVSLARDSFTVLKSRLAEMSVLTGFSPDALGYLNTALAFLYNRAQGIREDRSDHANAVEQIIGSLDFSEISEDDFDLNVFTERLRHVLVLSDLNERHWKVEELKNGFLPTATDFSSFVDFRPIFGSASGELEMEGCVVSTQFRIATDSPFEKDSFFVFQLTEDGVNDLAAAVDRLKRKIDVVKSKAAAFGEVML